MEGFLLDPQEEALWLLQNMVPESGVSNIGLYAVAPRRVRWWTLHQAFQWILTRNELLRSVYVLRGGSPRRLPRPPENTRCRVDVLSAPADPSGTLRDYSAMSFDLSEGPPIRVGLVDTPTQSVICVVTHHIVVDHAALQSVVAQLIAAHEAFAEGREPALTATATVAPALSRPSSAASLDYWRQRMTGLDQSSLELSGARRLGETPTFTGGCVERVLPMRLTAGTTGLGGHVRGAVTPNIVLLSAYYLLLLQEGAGPDLSVGVMIDRRPPSGGLVELGFRVDTVPLRVAVDPGRGFAELVSRVRSAFVEALDHPGVSFERLRRTGGATAGGDVRSWRTPFFRHLFNYRFRPWKTESERSLGYRLGHVDNGLARYDLELDIDDDQEDTHLRLVYSAEVHDRDQAEAYLDRYTRLLSAALKDPRRPLNTLDGVTPRERALVAALNETARDWPPGTLADLVADIAERRPEAPAVIEDGVAVSHGALLAAAERTRAMLAAHGVRRGDTVAVAGPRSARTAAALLGVWAQGAAYLPLDVTLPGSRLAFQMDDSGCRVLLDGDWLPAESRSTVTSLRSAVPETGGRAAARAVLDRSACASLDGTAYVIYTSGSSGTPKGVALTHRGVRNVVRHFAAALQVGPGDAMPWLTSLSFDISGLELWMPLAAGGRVVVAPDSARTEPEDFFGILGETGATLVQATPTSWRLLADAAGGRLRGLRVLCGGEPLTRTLADRILAGGCRLFNVYGPTETTIWSSSAEIRADGAEITVGRPIANTRLHVLDDELRPVPVGVRGELCVAGDGLAAGYVKRPELTAAAFRDHPRFGRIYRTGDLARLRHDGAVELIGRADRQVKVRAHRIELGEVEAVIEGCPGVRACAVRLGTADDGEPALAALVTGDCDLREVWRHLADHLPSYAVPATIELVASLPRTAAGKVDHRSLASRSPAAPPRWSPVRPRGADGSEADPLVDDLVAMWRDLLSVPELTADANFFLNGGHSLRAMRLTQRVKEVHGVELTMMDVFRAPTPNELARCLRIRSPKETSA